MRGGIPQGNWRLTRSKEDAIITLLSAQVERGASGTTLFPYLFPDL
jgi:hypothetical protein